MKTVRPNNILHAFLLLTFLLAMVFAHGKAGVSGWIDHIPGKPSVHHPFSSSRTQERLQEGVVEKLKLDMDQLNRLLEEENSRIDLVIPWSDGRELVLQLCQVNIFADDFTLRTGDFTDKNTEYDKGRFYRGRIAGQSGSIVSMSRVGDSMYLNLSTEDGQWEIVPDFEEQESYLVRKPGAPATDALFSCGTLTAPSPAKNPVKDGTQSVDCKTIKVSIECDYKLYQDFQRNSTSVTDYVSTLFNQVATIYQNEDIDLQLQEVKIWTSQDPFSSITSAGDLLTAFRNSKGENFNGTLCHFMTTRPIGGGMAYLDVLCNKAYAHSVSTVLPYNNPSATYSWSVEVVAHELGHNFGSNHTHWCGWQRADGQTGPLDNCYSSEGGCAAGPAPQNGGTIMSYCHLTGYGINFSKGFGQEPGTLMRSRVSSASCILPGGSVPSGLSSSNITTATARIAWTPVPNITDYTVELKAAGATTWTTLPSTTASFIQLNQLLAGTTYEWHVKTSCSVYSGNQSFTTASTSACPTPVGLVLSSVSGVTATLSWNPVIGSNTYSVQYRKSGTTAWNTVDGLSGNRTTLNGLTGTTTYNWRVKAECSSYSSIANFTTSSSGCPIPVTSLASNITTNGARLNWSTASGASGYVVSYKDQRESRWTTVNTNSTLANLSGLLPGTTYEWKVRSNCSNTSTVRTFITLSSQPMPGDAADSERAVELFPNPASTKIFLKTSPTAGFGKPVTAVISDMIGKTKGTELFQGSELEFDVSSLPEGLYIVQVQDEAGNVVNKRFMKR